MKINAIQRNTSNNSNLSVGNSSKYTSKINFGAGSKLADDIHDILITTQRNEWIAKKTD